MTAPARRRLWRHGDAVGLLVVQAMAVVLLVVAWRGTSRAVTTDGQDGWFGLGIAGLVVAGVGHGVWLLAGRSAVSRRVRWLAGDEAVRAGRLAETRAPTMLVGAAFLAHYHRLDCRLAAGRPLAPADRESHERLGRRPCGVCRP